ncbi:VPS9 domain-containing protein 1-like [Argonauta hians]
MDRSELNAVLKNVHDALRLDEDNRFLEAYGKYVECMMSIAKKLWISFTNTERDVLIRSVLNRYVTLGQQCMERISIILEKVKGSPCQNVNPKDQTCSRFILSNENFAPLSTLHNSSSNTFTKPEDMSPMVAAQKQNQQLLFAYKARMAQQNRKRQQPDLALTLQRKMAENIAIAKAREISLEKKMNERQKLLENEASRRFSLPTKLSKEQENRKQIYKKVLDYEMDMKRFQNLRQQLSKDPKKPEVIEHVIQSIFRYADHPLTALLYDYQQRVCRNILQLSHSRAFEVSEIKVPLTAPKTILTEPMCKVECFKTSIKSDPMKTEPTSENTSLSDYNGVKENIAASDKINQQTCGQSDKELSKDKIANNFKESPSDLENHTVEDQPIKGLEESNGVQGKLQREQKISNTAKPKIANLSSLAQFSNNSKDDEADDMDLKVFDEFSLTKSYSYSGIDVMDDPTMYIADLTDEAYQRHLHNINKDILLYNEKIMKMFLVCYEELNSGEGRDQTYACIEEMFISRLWPHLFLLYRIVHRDGEYKAAQVMTDNLNVMPQDVDIAPDLCLQQKTYSFGQFPYKSAVAELRSLKNLTTPLKKMECLVRVIRQICQCIADFQHQNNSAKKNNTKDDVPIVGADDLLPILHYVLIRSEQPELVSECAAIEELIHEGYLYGEGGYCLTSFQTALEYLKSLSTTTNN